MIRILAALAVLGAGQVQAQSVEGLPAGSYHSDPTHSMLVFHVDHLGLQEFTATFDTAEATLEIDPTDPGSARVTANVPVRSLDLPTPPTGFLDALMTEPWFDGAGHPEMVFTSDKVSLTGPDTADVEGTLDIKGVAAPLVLHVKFNGGYPPGVIEPTPRIGFSATGEISRTAFGMGEFVPAEGTHLGIGDAVRFEIEIEFMGPVPG